MPVLRRILLENGAPPTRGDVDSDEPGARTPDASGGLMDKKAKTPKKPKQAKTGTKSK
jgi:hypothetical protein